MQKPTTAFLHYSAPPVIGGVEAVMQAHARVFVENGYPVTVIAGVGDQQALPEETEFFLIPEMSTQHPQVLAFNAELEQGRLPAGFEAYTSQLVEHLRPLLRRFDNLIIHNVLTKHFNLPLTAALHQIIEAGEVSHCLAWCHDFTWTSPGSRGKVHPGYPWDLLRQRWGAVTYLTVSDARRKELAGLLDSPQEDIQVVYNGVDPTEILGLGEVTRALLDRMGWTSADLLLLMPVRITRAKNIEFLMDVLSAMRRRGSRASALVTGPPDPHSSESMAYLESLLERRRTMGLEDCLHFAYQSGTHGGLIIPQGVVGELYRAVDAVFLPSHREGFGMPVLEAALAGTPVITSQHVPAAQELGEDGVLIFPDDMNAGEVAGQMLDWIERNPIASFRRRARRNFTWQSIFERDIQPLLTEGPRK